MMVKRWLAFLTLSALLTFVLLACGTSAPAGPGAGGTAYRYRFLLLSVGACPCPSFCLFSPFFLVGRFDRFFLAGSWFLR